jgi:hypothetical protein
MRVNEGITIIHLNSSKRIFMNRLNKLNRFLPIRLEKNIVKEIETKIVNYNPAIAATVGYWGIFKTVRIIK